MKKIPTAANQSQFQFIVTDLPENTFIVQQFSGQMIISGHYQYQIQCTSQQQFDPQELLGKRAKLVIQGTSDNSYIHGFILSYHGNYIFTLTSNLASLLLRQSTQIFINQSVLEIIQKILQDANWSPSSFQLPKQIEFPKIASVIQYNESDLSFIERLLNQHGLFYLFAQKPESATLYFLDSFAGLPALSYTDLPFYTESGTNKIHESIYYFSEINCLLPSNLTLKNINDQFPNLDLTVTRKNQTELPGIQHCYDYGRFYKNTDDGQQLIRHAMQALDGQRQTFIIKTDCRNLQLGQTFFLSNHPNKNYHGEYRIIAMENRGQQLAEWNIETQTPTYEATCLAIKAKQPFQIFPQKSAEFLHILPAKIESLNNLQSTYLNAQGKYHLRFHFDQSQNPVGQASPPVSLLQPHGGATTQSQLTTGWHFPLRDGTQVVTGFIHGDLNQPIILGIIYHPNNPSPAIAQNNTQNIIRTSGGNELILEDKTNSPYTRFSTKDHKNSLLLDATPNQHQIQFISQEGAIQNYAKNNLQIITDDNFLQIISQNYLTNIQNNHFLQTENQTIYHQAKNNIELQANRNLQLISNHDIQTQSNQNTEIFATSALSLQVNQGNLEMQCQTGNTSIQANQNVFINANYSNLNIGSNTCNMQISAENFIFNSSILNFEAPEINVYGNINLNT